MTKHSTQYLYFIMHNTNQATENITHNNCGKKLWELFFISAMAMQLLLLKATNLPSYKTLLSPGPEDWALFTDLYLFSKSAKSET